MRHGQHTKSPAVYALRIFHQQQPHEWRKRRRLVARLWPPQNEQAGARGIAHTPSSVIDFQRTFQDVTNVALFAPMRFDEPFGEFKEPNLFAAFSMDLEACPRDRGFPRQCVEVDSIL